MTALRKICVVTTSRADFGLLRAPMCAIAGSPDFTLQLVVSGSHLSPEFGLSINEIEREGWTIAGRVEMLLSSDTPVGIAKSIGLGTLGFADVFQQLEPDLVMILGDRFELLAVGSSALVAKLPIAHLCGGDTTEGAYDEAVRHSLTKMSHLHFVSNEDSRRRVIQMGENPASVFNVGSPALDALAQMTFRSRQAVADELGLDPARHWLLLTFHPATLDANPALAQLDELLGALDELPAEQFDFVFTQPNADNDGRALYDRVLAWSGERPTAHVYATLGHHRYLECMSHAAAVVGNSSSGLYEAPSLDRPTVNIGNRQRGRLRAASVLDVPADRRGIRLGLERALAGRWSGVINPYGDGHASQQILSVLSGVPDYTQLLAKRFHELGGEQ